MKKFWISFIAILLGVAIGVGIWQGIVHKDKIKVFADKTWSKIESAFNKDNKQEDTKHNESDGKVFDESSLNGIYCVRDFDLYVRFTLMETDPHFMFVSGFTDVPHETFYWCSESKNAPRNAYVSLEKEYNGQFIYYYYENELKFVYDKDSSEFSIYVNNEKFLFSEKYTPIKSAHEVVPVVFVDEENRLCLEKEYTVSGIYYYCRVVGETEWKQIHSYKLNDEIKNGYMVEGSEYEIMCRFTCVGYNCDFRIDSEVIRYTAHFVHPSYGHVWSTEIVQDATCVDEGHSVSTCDVCGKVSESTISPKGHNYYFDETSRYWSQEEEKQMGTWICSRCGDEIVAEAPRIIAIETK